MKKLLAALFILFSSPAHAGITCTLPFTLQNNTIADATQVMANYNALVTCFTSAAASGVNSDITALTALATPLTPAQGGSSVYIGGTSTGTANAQVVASLSPLNFTLAAGKRITFIAGFTNTSATTLNASAQGATNIFRMSPSGPQALTGGEIIVGNVVEVIFDGTQFELISVHNQFGGFGILTTLSSAAPDLGTIPSHNVSISGTTTITSFGSTASVTFPLYRITFAGALTLTYNATSLILPGVINITTAVNDTALAIYLGSGNWQVMTYQRAAGTSVINPTPLCGASGFSLTNNSGTPDTSLDIAADSAVLINPTGNVAFYATSVSGTINTTVNAAVNRLDTGSLAASTWYNFFLISDGTTTGGLASLSATAPTMPSGYVYRCRLGAMRTDASVHFLRTLQIGKVTQYVIGTNPTIAPNIANGVVGTFSSTSPTLATASVSTIVPPTAARISLTATNAWKNGTTGSVIVAPNTAWGGTNNGPAGSAGQVYMIWLSSSNFGMSQQASMTLEATTIALASNAAGGAVSALGWEDKVNAN